MALFLLVYVPLVQLTIVAHWANLESKLLVSVPKIGHSHVNNGERVGQRSVEFQHRPLLP